VGSLRFLRVLAPLLLSLHILARLIYSSPEIFLDLILYNLIGVIAIVTILLNSSPKSRSGSFVLTIAIGAWTLGSTISSASEFFHLPFSATIAANICYAIFYPCLFLAIPKILGSGPNFGIVEFLDSTILVLGLGAMGSAFLLNPLLPSFGGDIASTFFAVFFPLADLILLALTFSLAVHRIFSIRGTILVLGIAIFTSTDFYFLWLYLNRHYALGNLVDDGWLFGIILVSESLWHASSKKVKGEALHPIFITLSVFMSATLISLLSLRPDYLPKFVIVPSVATLVLAFIRMAIALKQARSIGAERILARTDDLTGLPNRRQFIFELNARSKSASSSNAVLLLDLDGFKPINDLYGHEKGDQLLKEVSLRFLRSLPENALLARLGGDEFAVIVAGDAMTTLEVAQALRGTMSYPFLLGAQQINVSVSIGHVMIDGSSDILRRADSAMYQAKREGIGVFSEGSFNLS